MSFLRRRTDVRRIIAISMVTTVVVLHIAIPKLNDDSGWLSGRFTIINWSPLVAKPDNYRIYFHETSGRRDLNLRQTCAVESAAKENPTRTIQLFMQTDRLGTIGPWLDILNHYHNIVVLLINETEYFAGSPLEDWYRQGLWRQSPYRREHFSDYIRMLSLLRGGGLYMDLDFITLKPLDEKVLWNFLPVEDEAANSLTGSIFHLEHGHWLIDSIVHLLAARYNASEWGSYGPDLVTKVMTEQCGFKRNDISSNLCGDVRLLPYNYFYPIPFHKWEIYFQEAYEDRLALLDKSYGVHVWNKLSQEHPLVMGSDQLYSILAAEHCPLTFVRAAEFVMSE